MSEPEAAKNEYDPHLHRVVPRPTTNLETAFHIIKGTVGTGVLALPQAFQNCGLVNGVIFMAIIGIVSTWGMHILVNSQYVICKRLQIPLLRYPESMKVALEMGPTRLRPVAKYMPIIVNLFLIVCQLGFGCAYVLFISSNFKLVINDAVTLEMYILMIIIPLILMLSIRNLKLLAPFSLTANIIALFTFSVVGYYLSRNMPPIGQAVYFASPQKYPLFLGTTLFATMAIGVVMSAENNMLTPKGFSGRFGVLNISMIIVITLYICVGFFGYWRYGNDIKDTITLNLPLEEVLAKVVIIGYTLCIFVSYGLQEYVAVEILWNTYWQPAIANSPYQLLWEFLLRTVVLVTTVLFASTIPHLGLIISLVGALCLSVLGIIFPGIMEMCVSWSNISVPILCKDIFFIVFGVIGLLLGSGTAIYEIVIKFIK